MADDPHNHLTGIIMPETPARTVEAPWYRVTSYYREPYPEKPLLSGEMHDGYESSRLASVMNEAAAQMDKPEIGRVLVEEQYHDDVRGSAQDGEWRAREAWVRDGATGLWNRA